MKYVISFLLCGLVAVGVFNISASAVTTSRDLRYGDLMKPIVRYQFKDANGVDFNWETGEGHTAQTDVIPCNFLPEAVFLSISSVTADPTVDVTISLVMDGDEYTIDTFSTLADGTNHVFSVFKATPDFDVAPLYAGLDGVATDGVKISIDPSADAGGSGQTLTVKAYVKGK